MRRVIAIALLAGTLAALPAFAQFRGVPPSVTSMGPRGFSSAPPASVTSMGPIGFHNAPGFQFRFGFNPFPNRGFFPKHGSFPFPHHGRIDGRFGGRFNKFGGSGGFGGFGYGGVGVPYYASYPVYMVPYDVNDVEAVSGEGNTGMPTAPTVFENRPGGYVAPAPPAPQVAAATPQPAPAPQPAAPPAPQRNLEQESTILVFRDGHRVQVTNYAIVGDQLINLSGAPRKIAVAQLDLAATTQVNDERGVAFRLPVGQKR